MISQKTISKCVTRAEYFITNRTRGARRLVKATQAITISSTKFIKLISIVLENILSYISATGMRSLAANFVLTHELESLDHTPKKEETFKVWRAVVGIR